MRFHFLFFALIIVAATSSARASEPCGWPINYAAIFPPDINKFPIIFEKFRPASTADKSHHSAMGRECLFKDLEPAKVNALIQKFIDTHPEFEHKIVPPKEIDSLPANCCKYVVRTKLVEFESQHLGEGRTSLIYRIFKSVFYFTDMESGKEYVPFYNPRQQLISTSGKNLPAYPPKDKEFFKALSRYILQLNGG